ncbi:MAG: anaerobic ribonucleoside-triphosphate reductase [Candidatus Moranbacteria bacterium]|jgi:anaerobic ribonucleoside-triphosphate reductase|nr:anaerobic ribonucleoside-triphosphate reductase [Candidatus Moranbacteria bacterium]MDD5652470.1 anaerobic ribonucleoside-triphosphate reductase [Candidatus Moranbacteria bacterium]MDX9855976.1 anaerobic ribonucleoside-triphosphate reductase [Candidatus Moranbacteria bacterium]
MKEEIICHDCGKKLGKGEKFVRFSSVSKGEDVFKCEKCFDSNPALENFQACDVYSRVVGFHTPISRWNKGKSSEWKDRKTFIVEASGCASC